MTEAFKQGFMDMMYKLAADPTGGMSAGDYQSVSPERFAAMSGAGTTGAQAKAVQAHRVLPTKPQPHWTEAIKNIMAPEPSLIDKINRQRAVYEDMKTYPALDKNMQNILNSISNNKRPKSA
jgi:hypothetical protein